MASSACSFILSRTTWQVAMPTVSWVLPYQSLTRKMFHRLYLQAIWWKHCSAVYFLPQNQACVKLTKTPTWTHYITLGMNKPEMSHVEQTPYEPTRIWNNTSSSTEEEFWSLSVYLVKMGTSNLSRNRNRAKTQAVKEETSVSMWAEPQSWCGFRKALGSLALRFSKPRRAQYPLPGQGK